jgi:crotonobetainyl-CoA:carnitine CoA-transferase CaiB-like acyl-CoA transferase
MQSTSTPAAPSALSGLRVIDITHHISGPTCTMLLGDYGAEVLKIEPLDGEPLREGNVVNTGGQRSSFLAVNRNKQSLTINLANEEGRRIVHDMVRASDVFVENFRPGVTARLKMDYDTLSAINPRLIYCSITGFGGEGPYSHRPALDLVGQAMGGLMSITGEAGAEPLACGAPVADHLSGLHGLIGILLALQARERTGRGQRVEANMLNAMASLMSLRLQQFWATGEELKPIGSRHPQNTPWGIFHSGDGKRFVVAVSTRVLWERFCQALERTDLTDHPDYASNVGRRDNRAALEAELERWFATRPLQHWVDRLVSAGVPCSPVNSMGDMLRDEQIRANGIIAEQPLVEGGSTPAVGPPVKLGETPGKIRSASPSCGADTERVLRGFGYSEEQVQAFAAAGAIRLP